MADLTRRSFLTGAAALPFAGWLRAPARPQAPRVRYDARSPNGRAMLKTYARAVGQMKSKAEGDPTGWEFQWYTHWVAPRNPNLGPLDPRQKEEEIRRVYPRAGTWRDLAGEVWDTCQAHGGGDENMFLPWHRMFVYFFETIVRRVSGEDAFTLPYWDYSAPDPEIRGVIPPEFTRRRDPDLAPLYVENRNPGVNDGQPIQKGQPGDPLGLADLAECLYDPQGSDPGFCQALDAGLHGNVHVLVGDGRNMGSVPWAARDPIFWLHHCNIDRLWASWGAGGRAAPTLSRTFAFADKDGERALKDVADFMDIGRLGYSYDRLEKVPACPTTRAALLAAAKGQKRAAQVKAIPVQLGADPVRVTLEPLPEKEGEAAVPLPDRVKTLRGERRLYLVVKDLRAVAQPGVLYHLYLDLPSEPSEEQKKAHYVGSVNFFNAIPHGGHGEAKKGAERFVRFDITDLARALHSKKALGEKPTLMIAPAGRPAADAKPVIGEISVVER